MPTKSMKKKKPRLNLPSPPPASSGLAVPVTGSQPASSAGINQLPASGQPADTRDQDYIEQGYHFGISPF